MYVETLSNLYINEAEHSVHEGICANKCECIYDSLRMHVLVHLCPSMCVYECVYAYVRMYFLVYLFTSLWQMADTTYVCIVYVYVYMYVCVCGHVFSYLIMHVCLNV